MPDPTTEENIDAQIKKLIQKRVKSFNGFRRAHLVSVKANIAYLCGRQNIRLVGNRIIPIESKEPEHTRVMANKIEPAVRNDIAVATKTSPKFDIVPASTSEDDKATAKAGEKILPYLQRINDPHLHRKSVVLWYDLDGVGWRKVYWNPQYKATVGEDGNLAFEGEVVVEPVPNNELIFDYRSKNLRKLSWIIHHKTVTMGWIKKNEGEEKASQIQPEAIHEKSDENSFEVDVMGKFAGWTENFVVSPKEIDSHELLENDKLVNRYELWHVVDGNMPQGAYAVVYGDVDSEENLLVAHNHPYPQQQYPHGELPFIPSDPLNLDGITVGAVSRVSLARPLQREYNAIRTQMADGADAMGNCVIITARDANVDFKKVDNCNANIIEVDGPYAKGAVDRQPGVSMPSSLPVLLEIIRRDIDEIFAFHEPSKGQMPEGGPRSAIGLQVLKEGDDTQLSPMVLGLDISDERVVYQMLSLAIANYSQQPDKLIQIVGEDNQWTLEKLDPQQLNGKINVIVRTGSSLPTNKTLEMEKTVFGWQSGLFGNPQDPNIRQRVLKAMDLGDFEQILQDNAKQINFAQKEFIEAEKLVLQMPPLPEGSASINKDGQIDFADEETMALFQQYVYMPTINSFDDDFIHVQEHSNHLLSKIYEYRSSGSLALLQLASSMEIHIAMHEQRIFQQQVMMLRIQNPKLFADEKEASKPKEK